MIDCTRVMELFKEISRIPRGSGNREPISEYFVSFAKRNGLPFLRDTLRNVLITKPAAHGMEQAPALILQAHMDMVCVQDADVCHDFLKDPIDLYVDDTGWIRANGTSLGADDGLAVALMLAVLEDSGLRGPKLEFLFTVDEETDMVGAKGFDTSVLTGRYVINLDEERDAYITVSSAGIADVRIGFPLNRITEPFSRNDSVSVMAVSVDGLRGGHSGIDIHLKRLNALQVLSALADLVRSRAGASFRLLKIEGGTHMNAIPKAGEMIFSFAASLEEDIFQIVSDFFSDLTDSTGELEPDMIYFCRLLEDRESATWPPTVFQADFTDQLLSFMRQCPSGVLSMSSAFSDLVETSANFGRVVTADEMLWLWISFRSSEDAALDRYVQQFEEIGAKMGGRTEVPFREYGWPYQPRSLLAPYVAAQYRKVFGKDPIIKGIHAGLECGVFSRRIPGADIIAMGPNIEHPHTTGERAELASLEKIAALLGRILENFDHLE